MLDGYSKAISLPTFRSSKPRRSNWIIYLKTAKALGITIPLPLLGRADESDRINHHGSGVCCGAAAVKDRKGERRDAGGPISLGSLSPSRCATTDVVRPANAERRQTACQTVLKAALNPSRSGAPDRMKLGKNVIGVPI
jgi:hypothetical protein